MPMHRTRRNLIQRKISQAPLGIGFGTSQAGSAVRLNRLRASAEGPRDRLRDPHEHRDEHGVRSASQQQRELHRRGPEGERQAEQVDEEQERIHTRGPLLTLSQFS